MIILGKSDIELSKLYGNKLLLICKLCFNINKFSHLPKLGPLNFENSINVKILESLGWLCKIYYRIVGIENYVIRMKYLIDSKID